MKTTIDKAGRLVIPKAVRVAAGLEPGMEVEFRIVEGRVEIEPAPLDVQLERRGKLMVAVPLAATPTLTTAEVEKAIAKLRENSADDDRD